MQISPHWDFLYKWMFSSQAGLIKKKKCKLLLLEAMKCYFWRLEVAILRVQQAKCSLCSPCSSSLVGIVNKIHLFLKPSLQLSSNSVLFHQGVCVWKPPNSSNSARWYVPFFKVFWKWLVARGSLAHRWNNHCSVSFLKHLCQAFIEASPVWKFGEEAN